MLDTFALLIVEMNMHDLFIYLFLDHLLYHYCMVERYCFVCDIREWDTVIYSWREWSSIYDELEDSVIPRERAF